MSRGERLSQHPFVRLSLFTFAAAPPTLTDSRSRITQTRDRAQLCPNPSLYKLYLHFSNTHLVGVFSNLPFPAFLTSFSLSACPCSSAGLAPSPANKANY